MICSSLKKKRGVAGCAFVRTFIELSYTPQSGVWRNKVRRRGETSPLKKIENFEIPCFVLLNGTDFLFILIRTILSDSRNSLTGIFRDCLRVCALQPTQSL